MKRIFLIISILIFSMSIFGCKSSGLTKKTKEYIIETYVKKYNEKEKYEAFHINSEDVEILYYFGKYGESHVAVLINSFSGFNWEIPEDVIKDLEFSLYGNYFILVFNEDNCYHLEDAYELNIITYEDAKKIHESIDDCNKEIDPYYYHKENRNNNNNNE